ncbi:hypothetical protein SDC9_78854 [bioreactor metagenome]|uniref:Uncharacterized protein n=1 Tax=bioreactor metagenome TaxID=1076179 RepID=A0A644YUP8_9ZZZZ
MQEFRRRHSGRIAFLLQEDLPFGFEYLSALLQLFTVVQKLQEFILQLFELPCYCRDPFADGNLLQKLLHRIFGGAFWGGNVLRSCLLFPSGQDSTTDSKHSRQRPSNYPEIRQHKGQYQKHSCSHKQQAERTFFRNCRRRPPLARPLHIALQRRISLISQLLVLETCLFFLERFQLVFMEADVVVQTQ